MRAFAPSFDLDLHLRRAPVPASMPPEMRGLARDAVKMLVVDRATQQVSNAHFHDIADYLQPGDVLVVNTSATIPGRLEARHRGQALKVHLATKLSATEYILERRTARGGPDRRAFQPGDAIEIIDPMTATVVTTVHVLSHFHANSRLWRVQSGVDLFHVARDIGTQIRYNYVEGDIDPLAYRTIFARQPGSAEMPSASRPFTYRTLQALGRRGVHICSLVLHTGVSSHEVESDLAHHPVLPEWYDIPAATAQVVNCARHEGRRVIAVGTTVVRALESAVGADGRVQSASRWTTHLITPSTPPRVVTSLVTGMHESQTSHLALMYAFLPPAQLRKVYEQAIAWGYLWHEFGDINLIL